MTWRPARCLDVLIKQVNTAYPTRPKQSDGLIGDQAHTARVSSHNPDEHGVVRGWDITTAPFCQQLADQLVALGRIDQRVWYVIWNRRIASREHGFIWRPYTGTDPHTGHIHLSVSDDPAIYDRTDPWPVLDLVHANTTSPPAPLLEENDMHLIHSPSHSQTLVAANGKGGLTLTKLTAAQAKALGKTLHAVELTDAEYSQYMALKSATAS